MLPPIQRVYVIHTHVHEQERGTHIRQQVQALGLPYTFVMEGEANEVMAMKGPPHVGGKLLQQPGLASCSYKHFRAYQCAVQRQESCIMVLENDIFFAPQWKQTLTQALREIAGRKITGYVLSIEDSSLHYPPRSQRKPGMLVYPAPHPRMAGAYIMDLEACKAMENYLTRSGLYAEPDWHLHDAHEKGLVKLFWLHPAVAEQGSHNGRMQTAFNSKSKNRWNRFRWKIKKWYRKYVLYHWR